MGKEPTMTIRLTKKLAPAIALFLLVGGVFALSNHTVSAQDSASTIKVMESSVTSEFPEGYRIKVVAEAENDIKQIAVRMRIGQRTREVYEYMGDEGGEASGGRGRTLDLTPANRSGPSSSGGPTQRATTSHRVPSSRTTSMSKMLRATSTRLSRSSSSTPMCAMSGKRSPTVS